MSDTQSHTWVETYWVESWSDAQALRDPRWSPRGHRKTGPFRSYEDAANYVPTHLPAATHFQVSKITAQINAVVFLYPDGTPEAASEAQ